MNVASRLADRGIGTRLAAVAAGLVATVLLAVWPQVMLGDEPGGFSLGGRPLKIKRGLVIEPYSSDSPPGAISGGRFGESGLGAPTASSVPPTAVERESGNPLRAADRADDPLADRQVNRAGGSTSSASTASRVVPASGLEPSLIPNPAPPISPMVIYQPVPMPMPQGSVATVSAHTIGTTVVMMTAGFVVGITVALALLLVPVAIVLRRPMGLVQYVSDPRGLASVPVHDHSASENPPAENREREGAPAATRAPIVTLADTLAQERAQAAEDERLRTMALFEFVLKDNLKLQEDLQRRADAD